LVSESVRPKSGPSGKKKTGGRVEMEANFFLFTWRARRKGKKDKKTPEY